MMGIGLYYWRGLIKDLPHLEHPADFSLKVKLEGYPHGLVLLVKDIKTVRSLSTAKLTPILQTPYKF